MSNQNRLSRLIGKDWLDRYTTGLYTTELTELSDDILDEIWKFTVLWQLFEKLVLGNYEQERPAERIARPAERIARPAERIVRAANSWSQKNRNIDFNFFKDCLRYFQNRYVDNGEINDRFKYLGFRVSADRKSVDNALKREIQLVTNEDVSGVLILVCQYRHRLFHAAKDLSDQKENFEHANAVLKKAIEWEQDV